MSRVIKQKMATVGELSSCGDVYTEEGLRQAAEEDIHLRFEPEDSTLYMYLEVAE